MDAERELKKALKSGDPAKIKNAFERLYREHVRLVYRVYLDSFGKDDETDDDIQEAFLCLLQNAQTLLTVDHIVGYWIQSAKYIRGHRKEKQQRIEELDEEVPNQGKGIPELVQGKEFLGLIEQWLGNPDAEIVILHAAYDYSEKEIADRLNMGEDAVSYRYRKAIKELRRRLKNEEE